MIRTRVAILKVLDGASDITGSREVSRKLRAHGIDLTERTVRYHMRILDERGYTEVYGKEGRRITDKGRSEMRNSNVSEQIGFVSAKIESLSYLTTLNLESMKGTTILNVSFIPEGQISKAIGILKRFFSSPFSMCNRLIFAPAGEQIGDIVVPEGKVGLGTVCSVTINGLFLKTGIPVTSRYGGVLEISGAAPKRFTSLISYEGSSLDPLEIFIRGKMTDVTGCVKNGSGSILASFREIPVVCLKEAVSLSNKMAAKGIGGVLSIGKPNTPFLDIPVGIDKAGMVFVGGLNPVASLDEAGIVTHSRAMSALIEYERLRSFDKIAEELS
jgi:repressor of nif and glnA expression